jgi:DNA-directed RNA polymerase sigma subunit (sigma70/sigma32)
VDQAGYSEGWMARTYNELSTELKRKPTDEEVAERLGWNVDRVKNVKRIA